VLKREKKKMRNETQQDSRPPDITSVKTEDKRQRHSRRLSGEDNVNNEGVLIKKEKSQRLSLEDTKESVEVKKEDVEADRKRRRHSQRLSMLDNKDNENSAVSVKKEKSQRLSDDDSEESMKLNNKKHVGAKDKRRRRSRRLSAMNSEDNRAPVKEEMTDDSTVKREKLSVKTETSDELKRVTDDKVCLQVWLEQHITDNLSVFCLYGSNFYFQYLCRCSCHSVTHASKSACV